MNKQISYKEKVCTGKMLRKIFSVVYKKEGGWRQERKAIYSEDIHEGRAKECKVSFK